MLEFLSTDIGKIFFSSLIATFVAILTIMIRDYFLYERREKKNRNRALLDRKLSKLYSPLYVHCVSGNRTISNILHDEVCYALIIENQHLFSNKLQSLFSEYCGLTGGLLTEPTFKVTDGNRMIEITKEFSKILKSETEALINEYQS